MLTPRQQYCLEGMGICAWRERGASSADAATGLALDPDGGRARHDSEPGGEALADPGAHGDSQARSVPDGGVRASAGEKMVLDQDGDRAHSRPVSDGAIRATAGEGDRARRDSDPGAEASPDHHSDGDMQARSVLDGGVRTSAGEKMVLDQDGDRAHSRPVSDGAIRATAGEGDRARRDSDPGAEALADPGAHGDSQARSVPDGGVRASAEPALDFENWDGLIEAIHACEACELAKNCTQKVPGVGSREADLMIIGEGPGHDEDIRGEPFVGRSGQLLDRMLAAIGIAREQVYITNIVKCRPPNNRDPKPEEALMCRGFLEAQIRAIEPRVILSVGRVSAHNLLDTSQPVGKLIRQMHTLPGTDIPVKVTYHPAYLLRTPSAKATAWQDLKQLHRLLK